METDLGRDPEVLASDSAVLDALSDLGFVSVDGRTVNVPSIQRSINKKGSESGKNAREVSLSASRGAKSTPDAPVPCADRDLDSVPDLSRLALPRPVRRARACSPRQQTS